MAGQPSAWAKPGSWALDSEEHEAADMPPPPSVPAADFPSLATAAATKAPKKKKAQPVSLADFNAGKFVVPASRGPTPDELLVLPSGPRERTAEELDRAGCGDSRWGSGRGGSGGDREFGSSRADEVDDWSTTKKPIGMADRRERMGAFAGDSHSRADESASWVSTKRNSGPAPPPADAPRRGGSVWGFNKDSGLDSNSWGKKREEVINGGRRPLVLQPRTLPLANGSDGAKEEEKGEAVTKSKRANPFGAARPREEVLAAKGEDWRKIDEKLEAPRGREAQPDRRSIGNGRLPESRAEDVRGSQGSDDCSPTSAL